MGKYVDNIKVAKNLTKSSPTAMDVLYLIMLHIDWNVDKKFQSSIFCRSQDIPKRIGRTYGPFELYSNFANNNSIMKRDRVMLIVLTIALC